MILFDTIVKVKRQKSVEGNRRDYVATATGDASIQPIAREPNSLVDGMYGTLYTAYVEVDLPVRVGDRVTDPEGIVYIVREAIKRDTAPFPHTVLTLNKQTT